MRQKRSEGRQQTKGYLLNLSSIAGGQVKLGNNRVPFCPTFMFLSWVKCLVSASLWITGSRSTKAKHTWWESYIKSIAKVWQENMCKLNICENTKVSSDTTEYAITFNWLTFNCIQLSIFHEIFHLILQGQWRFFRYSSFIISNER